MPSSARIPTGRFNDAARKALAKDDALKVPGIVLSRMYTLCNQLVHGGATWNSSINRDRLRDCTNFLGKLVPFFITLMMDSPAALWGLPAFRWLLSQLLKRPEKPWHSFLSCVCRRGILILPHASNGGYHF
jgi:hypothetical protein